jgi:hypothetical protein
MVDSQYLLKLDYGDRRRECSFVKRLMSRFDNETLRGIVLFANNNPYALELFLFLNFVSKTDEFEAWLSGENERKRFPNYFLQNFYVGMRVKSYNSVSLVDDEEFIDHVFSGHANELFLFPDKELMEKEWPTIKRTETKVFLSHSSKDKPLVDKVYNELQKKEVSAWYDTYEIRLGDSITAKINEGLSKSDIGVLFLSKEFINSKTGWTMAEANFFFQKRMQNGKRFLVVNLDLDHDQLPPLLQDFKYLNSNSYIEIAESIKREIVP